MQISVTAGSRLTIRVSHNDDTIWVEAGNVSPPGMPLASSSTPVLTSDSVTMTTGAVKPFVLTAPPVCTCNIHSLCSPARLALWHNDAYVRFLKALTRCAIATGASHLLLISDDPFAALVATSLRSDVAPMLMFASTYLSESMMQSAHERCLLEFMQPRHAVCSLAAAATNTSAWVSCSVIDVMEEASCSEGVCVIDPFAGLTADSCFAFGRWCGVSAFVVTVIPCAAL
jgi:hypothetical protein